MLTVASSGVLCWVPSASGKSEIHLHWGLPLLSDRPEGTYSQPLPGKGGLATRRVQLR
jgi:hypothetical protein